MDIEKLLQESIGGEDSNRLDEFIDAILDHWVYFYFHETSGSDTKPGESKKPRSMRGFFSP
jgi:hypothetical protein